jgi:hypothetical protein
MKAKLLATSALALLAATLPVANAFAATAEFRAHAWTVSDTAIAGDDGVDEFGDDDFYDEDGTLTDNPDRADQGEIGEQGEYRDGEYGERDNTGWNPPPDDHADESGELLDSIDRGSGNAPPPNSGAPLVNSTGQGSSGGLMD